MRKVEVIPYQEKWNTLFQLEREKLQAILNLEIRQIHHIGSTSIKEMYAKPVIDILISVNDIERIDDYSDRLVEIGYRALGENGLSGRRFFIKGGDEPTHHVHIYQDGHKDINRHLAFRDYMRTFPEERKTYSFLKQKLAEANPTNIEEYINGKHDYIQMVERQAVIWSEQKANIIYKINSKVTTEQLVQLYKDVGWTAYTKDPDKLIRAVSKSLFYITAWLDGELIGLIRVVGDGETIIYIQDILVRKRLQRKGIATALMEKVLVQFEHVRQKVLLTNDHKDVRQFYEKHKFTSCDQGDLVAFARLGR